jgi:hypothetical protein
LTERGQGSFDGRDLVLLKFRKTLRVFACDSRPLFCRISRTSKEARRSGISTMSMAARIVASKTFRNPISSLRSVRMVQPRSHISTPQTWSRPQNRYCKVLLSTAWYLADLGEARGVLFRDQRSPQPPCRADFDECLSTTDYWVQGCFKLLPWFC